MHVACRFARVAQDGLHVVEQRGRDEHLPGLLLQVHQFGGLHLRRELGDEVAPVYAGQQVALRLRIRIAQLDAHQEAVELRFRQREGADLVGRVLRGDDEERHRQRARLAFAGDLVFFHRLQQGALRLGRGAVHFVGQDHLREDRPGVELEFARVALVDGDAEDVGGQHVAGELDALELQAERPGQCMRQHGLADAGQVFNQQMPACQQASERQPDLARLAENDLLGLGNDFVQWMGHAISL